MPHLLSLFPEILFLGRLSPLLIRVALAIVLAYSAWHLFSKSDWLSRLVAIAGAIIGIALFVGAWTQAAALGALFVIGLYLFVPSLRTVALGTALLSIVLALSLLVTGPGAYAFDWPL